MLPRFTFTVSNYWSPTSSSRPRSNSMPYLKLSLIYPSRWSGGSLSSLSELFYPCNEFYCVRFCVEVICVFAYIIIKGALSESDYLMCILITSYIMQDYVHRPSLNICRSYDIYQQLLVSDYFVWLNCLGSFGIP